MPKSLSFQLYSARNFPPLDDVFALLAGIGYREVEGYGGIYDDPAGLKRLLDRHGLTMPTGHFGLDMLEGDPDRALAIAATLGIRRVYAPWLDPADRPVTEAGYRAFGDRLAAIGRRLRGEGLGFGWHNHDFEFAALPSGAIPQDIILAADPLLEWEFDLAWAVRAGADPVAWINRHSGRITAVHVKDLAPPGANAGEDGWADVGHGIIDWPACLAALASSPVAHVIMEHDNPADLRRFATRSFETVSSL